MTGTNIDICPNEVKSSGNKYHRQIIGIDGVYAITDIYRVLSAFAVTSPAIQHAVKKLLCAGLRGKGGVVQDLTEAIDAIRAELLKIEQTKTTSGEK